MCWWLFHSVQIFLLAFPSPLKHFIGIQKSEVLCLDWVDCLGASTLFILDSDLQLKLLISWMTQRILYSSSHCTVEEIDNSNLCSDPYPYTVTLIFEVSDYCSSSPMKNNLPLEAFQTTLKKSYCKTNIYRYKDFICCCTILWVCTAEPNFVARRFMV